MTEAEWYSSTDPQKMLESLRGRPSDRKLRLFAVACCRRIWPLLADKRSKNAVVTAEQFSDGFCTQPDLAAAFRAAEQPCFDAINRADGWDDCAMAAIAAKNAAAAVSGDYPLSVLHHAAVLGDHHDTSRQAARQVEQCRLLRDVFGNPFRPRPPLDPRWLAWEGATVPKLAQVVYDDRQLPSGHLDPARLAVLADALEDAGCADPDILGHLRQPGAVHVRGCWVVDLLTAKE